MSTKYWQSGLFHCFQQCKKNTCANIVYCTLLHNTKCEHILYSFKKKVHKDGLSKPNGFLQKGRKAYLCLRSDWFLCPTKSNVLLFSVRRFTSTLVFEVLRTSSNLIVTETAIPKVLVIDERLLCWRNCHRLVFTLSKSQCKRKGFNTCLALFAFYVPIGSAARITTLHSRDAGGERRHGITAVVWGCCFVCCFGSDRTTLFFHSLYRGYIFCEKGYHLLKGTR